MSKSIANIPDGMEVIDHIVANISILTAALEGRSSASELSL